MIPVSDGNYLLTNQEQQNNNKQKQQKSRGEMQTKKRKGLHWTQALGMHARLGKSKISPMDVAIHCTVDYLTA